MTLSSKEWRLTNIYRIVDKDGNSIPFRLNAVQQNALSIAHKRKLFLKARQLGMSTFAVIDALDDVIFSENLSGGIVSYSIEHAQHIFKKIIGHALDTFPDKLKPFLGITARSAREITFSNGSSLRVDTTLRGGSYQNVLVSEFGKTCARYPQKAEEIVTGTLQAIGAGGKVTIESTGEGSDGYFAEMIIAASQHKNEGLTDLDYWLCFYPWYCDTSYKIDASAVKIDAQLAEYFRKIEQEQGITLSQEQKTWYAVQSRTLGDKIKQEYPSTISEAFLSKSDAYYFAESVKKAWDERRCLYTPLYDALQPVYVAMDIGLNDLTVLIFFQLCHGEIRVIDYYEDSNKDVPFYAHFLQNDKKYLYHTIFLPHDAEKRDILDVNNSYVKDFRRLFGNTQTKFHVLARQDKQLSISNARIKIDRCVFNVQKCKKLTDQLSKYRKKWNESAGRYEETPYHNDSSHYADAFQYAMQAVAHLEAAGSVNNALERHRQATEARLTKKI